MYVVGLSNGPASDPLYRVWYLGCVAHTREQYATLPLVVRTTTNFPQTGHFPGFDFGSSNCILGTSFFGFRLFNLLEQRVKNTHGIHDL
jgi:hypothetical protein